MRVFDANITDNVISFFRDCSSYDKDKLNVSLEKICGIEDFFETQSQIDVMLGVIKKETPVFYEPDRAEYGDFQTNKYLTERICQYIKEQDLSHDVLVEPTCGKGGFLISGLKVFAGVKNIYGVEIYKPYVWETKFSILDFFLRNKDANKPKISIIHKNVFDFDFNELSDKHKNDRILILGNPPWVTNSKLSTLDSKNLPPKSNFKYHSGIDVITGKGNFDIGEYITLKLLDSFSDNIGTFALLVKNSVVKNILVEQKRKRLKISDIKQFDINAKLEFNVSVNACLFYGAIGKTDEYSIKEFDFYTKHFYKEYGWFKSLFVSDLESYKSTFEIDGLFPVQWRQGVKHDSSKIMELKLIDGKLVNNKNEIVEIENDLVFGLVKSSDLKGDVVSKPRRYTIITQKKTGQDTGYIKKLYPKTFKYLFDNIEHFNSRKSSIYNGKPSFSIFGIGEYSFKPYKVAISGMYKTTKFSLVVPFNNKPLMLDDTCYFVGYDSLIEAEITRYLLNTEICQSFINSISFDDAKRKITKELLMRINLKELIDKTELTKLQLSIDGVTKTDWENYKKKFLTKEKNSQLRLFELNA